MWWLGWVGEGVFAAVMVYCTAQWNPNIGCGGCGAVFVGVQRCSGCVERGWVCSAVHGVGVWRTACCCASGWEACPADRPPCHHTAPTHTHAIKASNPCNSLVLPLHIHLSPPPTQPPALTHANPLPPLTSLTIEPTNPPPLPAPSSPHTHPTPLPHTHRSGSCPPFASTASSTGARWPPLKCCAPFAPGLLPATLQRHAQR